MDGFVQVAPDGGGKKIDMDLVSSAADPQIYRQKAVLVGDTGAILDELLRVSRLQLKVLRCLLALTQESNPMQITEEDISSE
jgi:hypothetical protein